MWPGKLYWKVAMHGQTLQRMFYIQYQIQIKFVGPSFQISFFHMFILILNFICYLKYNSSKPIFHQPTPCGALGPISHHVKTFP